MKKKLIIAGNWKMNKTPKEAVNFLEKFLINVEASKCKTVLFVPFVDIEACARLIEKSNINIKIGAQNFYWEDSGAYTGEISIPMLESIGTQTLLVGHSERRINFGETEQEINKKVKRAINSNLDLTLCVGETLEQRDSDKGQESVLFQLKNALENVPKSLIHKVCIAYEPVWAIGTGKTATPYESNKMCRFIRMCIEKMYGSEVGLYLDVLYGGSVNEKNCKSFFEMSDINGILVGGTSLREDCFGEIVKVADNLMAERSE